MNSRPAMRPKTFGEWVHFQNRMVNRAVDLLAGLIEEHGAEIALSRQSPEFGLVVNIVGLVVDAGGSVALDALVKRLRGRLAEDLSREELATAMGDLGSRIRDVGGRA